MKQRLKTWHQHRVCMQYPDLQAQFSACDVCLSSCCCCCCCWREILIAMASTILLAPSALLCQQTTMTSANTTVSNVVVNTTTMTTAQSDQHHCVGQYDGFPFMPGAPKHVAGLEIRKQTPLGPVSKDYSQETNQLTVALITLVVSHFSS